MKKFWRNITVYTITFILSALTVICCSADAGSKITLEGNAVYEHRNITNSEGVQNLHTVTVPAGDIRYRLRLGLSGGYVSGRENTLETAKAYQGPGKLVAGINGGFFMTEAQVSGVPYGFLMQDGEMYTSPAQDVPNGVNGCDPAVVIVDRNGKVSVTDAPQFQGGYSIQGTKFKIHQINRMRQPADSQSEIDSVVLYTNRYGATTQTKGGTEVRIRVKSGTVSPNGIVRGEVLSIEKGGNTKLESGVVVLSFSDLCNHQLSYFRVGESIRLDLFIFGGIQDWDTVDFAFGGPYIIARDGKLTQLPESEPVYFKKNPRTMLGVKPDGTMIFVASEGRKPGVSDGMTCKVAAETLLNMGYTTILNLDGGGSTTLVTGENGKVTLRNTPSDGEMRKVADSLLLVWDASYKGYVPPKNESSVLLKPTSSAQSSTVASSAVSGTDRLSSLPTSSAVLSQAASSVSSEPVAETSSDYVSEVTVPEKNEHSSGWVWWIIGAAVLLLGGGAGCTVWYLKKKESEK